MSIISQILSSDPELTELRLVEDIEAYTTDPSELTDALLENKIIDYVRLDRDFLPSMVPEDTASFFKAFGKLPNLKEAQVWHASIPVTVLADFLNAARGLEHLQFGCLDLDGTEADFALVSAALQGHPSLKSFSMHDFSLTANDMVSLDGLIATLATIPNLSVVKLEVTHSRRRSLVGSEAAAKKVSVSLKGEALASLCRKDNLTELYLNRLNLSLDDYGAIGEAIKTAPNLKVLALPHCNLDDQACIAFSEAIGQSKTIEKIDLSCNRLTDEGCITLASGLKGNESVKFLRLWGNVKISNAGFDTVREMLEQSCNLERVPLMTPGKFENRIDADKVVMKQSQAHAA